MTVRARIDQRGKLQRIIPPSGRSYYVVDEMVIICGTCKGEGHYDSCFECGNRGYNFI